MKKSSKSFISIIISLLLIITTLSSSIIVSSAAESMGEKYYVGNRDFGWPVPNNYNIMSCFLDPDAIYKTHERTKYHNALDIKADLGTTVVASYPGKVVYSGNNNDGYGNCVAIKHDNYKLKNGNTITLYTRYNHLSKCSVSTGATVSKGQKIGEVGDTGFVYGAHLDFQINTNAWNSGAIDPYANYMLELPSGLYKSASTDCCADYINKVKALYSAKPGLDINEGYYIIESKMGNKVLDVVNASKNDEANIQIWKYANISSQKFKIKKNESAYLITAMHSGKAVDVAGAGTAPGTNVQQYQLDGHVAQNWTFEDAGNGYVYIKSGLGNYLDVKDGYSTDGTNIWTYSFNGSDAQQFRLIPIAGTTTVSPTEGDYIIESKMGSKVLDVVNGSQNDEANIQLKTNSNLNSQKFKIKKNGSSYIMTALHSGKAIDVAGAIRTSGTNVQQYQLDGHAAQNWTFEDAGNGYVYIKSDLGCYLDVKDGKTADGTNVWVYTFNGSDAQQFRLIPTSATNAVSVTEGDYIIESKMGNKVLDVANGSQNDEANIQLKTNSNLNSQKFKIKKNGSSYIMTALHSGKAIDVAGASSKSGTNVQQYQIDGNAAQNWIFEDAGNGYIYIKSALGCYLDVKDGKTADGTNIWVYTFNGSDAQKFKLISTTKTEDNNQTNENNQNNNDNDNIINNTPTPPIITPNEIHFSKYLTYTQGQFTDVAANQWFTENVANAVRFGLMKGNSTTTFNPYGDVTIAEAVTMASRIHSIYTKGFENFVQGDVWYQCYLDYALQNGIITNKYYNTNVSRKATRSEFAEIFSNALPDEALSPINNVADNAIPDVKTSSENATHIYKLYRAGILTGGDVMGTFSSLTFITRAECATIVARMADTDNRKRFTLV